MSPTEQWIIDHLPESIAVALLTVIGWFTKREVNRFTSAMKKVPQLELRVNTLESDRVTREDFDELRESMNATFTNGMERIEKTQNMILENLLRGDKR